MRVAAIVNEAGGAVAAGGASALLDRIEAAFASRGVAARVETARAGSMARCFEAAADAGFDAIVAAGGDGTVSAAAATAVRTGTPLGVIPLGTLNHFARDAGIPPDIEGAVETIAAGNSTRVDVGELNGRIFVNTSAIGLYPLMVDDREAQRRRLGRSKRLAMLVASLRAFRHFRRRLLAIRVQGREAPVLTPLLFVGNNRYETRLLGLGRRERLDGGALCLYAVLARHPPHLLGLALRGLVGRLDQQSDFLSLDHVEAAEIGAHARRLAVSLDGETVRMEVPLRYRIRPGALRLLVPRGAGAGDPS